MFGALLYLRLMSLRNLVVQRVLRLRQPKYLVGTVAALAYFYFILLRRTGGAGGSLVGGSGPGGGGVLAVAVISGAVCLGALLRIAFAWISPAEKPGLRFSEAEIAFLFPAPITRRSLIHFRLLSAQFAILFTSALMAIFFNRSGYLGGNRVLHALGWWVILSTFDLHLSGTTLTLSRLRETSPRFLLWRIVVPCVLLLYVVLVFWSLAGPAGAYFSGVGGAPGAPEAFVAQVGDSPAFHALTLPFRIVLGPYFAPTLRAFAVAMVPALALLALHYYWVSHTEAHFEEGSIAMAEKRTAVRAAAMRGEMPKIGSSKLKARSGPFPLSPTGPPEIAFLWKNLLSMKSSLFGRRSLVILAAVMVWMAASLGPLLRGQARTGGLDVFGPMIVVLCAMIAGYTVLLGPQLARQDLRSDLANIDILKTYPMEGWRLAMGELLAPTVLLTLILWFTIIASSAAIDAGHRIEWLTPGVRVTVAVCLGSAAPFLCLIQLIVPNAIMVILPGWYQASRSRAAGIEMFGQRLIFGFVQLLFALLVAVPAAGTAAVVIFSSKWVFGIGPAVVLAALAVLTILVSEAAVGLWWLGQRFGRFDVSTESR